MANARRTLGSIAIIFACAISRDVCASPFDSAPHVFAPTPHPPPRFRLRLGANLGFGSSSSAFALPVSVDLAVRAYRFLSVVVATTGIVSAAHVDVCGGRRPNAFVGSAGLRADGNNRHGDSWLSPFVEAHASVGGERAIDGVGGDSCRALDLLVGGGARAGFDIWAGKSALSIAVGFEYVPAQSVGFFSIGWGRALR